MSFESHRNWRWSFPLRFGQHSIRQHGHQGAFSLLEVLCAMLILSISVVGITPGITTALKSHKDSELLTNAGLFAAGLIETLRAEGGLMNGTEEGECGAALPMCNWKQSVAGTDTDGLHEVTVIVHFADSERPIYELRTLLFEVPTDSRTTQTGSDKGKRKGSR
jgi:prepilin-type N-terminal cleavage/methylation domain-containing protein